MSLSVRVAKSSHVYPSLTLIILSGPGDALISMGTVACSGGLRTEECGPGQPTTPCASSCPRLPGLLDEASP